MKRPAKLLGEVEESLAKRIKLIKIADSSSAGWDIVDQYEMKHMGSDSEDERSIRAAERRALVVRPLPDHPIQRHRF